MGKTIQIRLDIRTMAIGECPTCKAMTIDGNCTSTHCDEARTSFKKGYEDEIRVIEERRKKQADEARKRNLERLKQMQAEMKRIHDRKKREGEMFWKGLECQTDRTGKWFEYLRSNYLNKGERARSIYVVEVAPECGLEKRFGSSKKWMDLGLDCPRGFFYVGHTGKSIEDRYEDHMKGHKSNIKNNLCKASGSPDFENHCRQWTEKYGFERMIPYDEKDDWESYVGWSLAEEGYVVFGPHDPRPKEEFPYL
jgi:hypothetical protein